MSSDLKQHKDRFRSVALDRLERELTSFYDLPHIEERPGAVNARVFWTIWQRNEFVSLMLVVYEATQGQEIPRSVAQD